MSWQTRALALMRALKDSGISAADVPTISIPIDRATEYVPELGNIRSCVRPEEYVYDWQKDGL